MEERHKEGKLTLNTNVFTYASSSSFTHTFAPLTGDHVLSMAEEDGDDSEARENRKNRLKRVPHGCQQAIRQIIYREKKYFIWNK